MYDLEVASPTHNFLLPNGVVTSNSHACAYTYVSSRQLFLKSHFPLEFYASLLRFEDKPEKIKEYREVAAMHDIPVNALDMNKSKVYFDIASDNAIYVGFSTLQGVGPAVAERVVEKQPYEDLHGFLSNFGTDAKVLSALVGLRVFNKDPEDDQETVRLRKYYEWYKDRKKKAEDRRKRFENGVDDIREEIKALLPEEDRPKADVEDLTLLSVFGPEDDVKVEDEDSVPVKIKGLIEKYRKKRERYANGADKDVIRPEDFKPEEVELEEAVLNICTNRELGEQTFYGFLWTHPLERSPEYKPGSTLERIRELAPIQAQNGEERGGYVQLLIKTCTRMESKKTAGFFYWLCDVEDSNGEKAQLQLWADDWERFADDLTPPKDDVRLVNVRVLPPDPRWPTRYQLFSWPRHLLRQKRPRDKATDYRVIQMTTYKQGKAVCRTRLDLRDGRA